LSSVLLYVPGVVLHISRGVRWDSDHVVILSDETEAMLHEVVTSGALERIHIGLDFFDASINRIAAWAIGARNVLRAALLALLEADGRITNTGGGNTSAKIMETDPLTSEQVPVLWVKGSGGDLRTAGRENFSSLYMDKLLALQQHYHHAPQRGPKSQIEDDIV